MSRRRSHRTTEPRAVLLVAGTFGALAASIVAAVRRRRAQADARPGSADWKCECGQGYRVTGQGRHRVYWPAGADRSEPVVDGSCVSCERPLPAT